MVFIELDSFMPTPETMARPSPALNFTQHKSFLACISYLSLVSKPAEASSSQFTLHGTPMMLNLKASRHTTASCIVLVELSTKPVTLSTKLSRLSTKLVLKA